MAVIKGFTVIPIDPVAKGGEIIKLRAKVDYANPPITVEAVVRAFGQVFKTKPIHDRQPPLIFEVPVQVPPTTVVPGRTITNYPIGGGVPPMNGSVPITVELYQLDGGRKLVGRRVVTVTIVGGKTTKPPVPSRAEKPSLLKLAATGVGLYALAKIVS